VTPVDGPTPEPGHWRLLLIVNPTAAKVNARARRAVEEILAANELHVAETVDRDHATDLARQAAADGCDAVVVLGGDGTLNEAANGLVGTSTALAALPGGSTSVYARTVGMARNPVAAAGQLRDALDAGSIRRASAGSVNGRHFLFHLGAGYDAAVVGQVEGFARLKRTVGQAIFVYAAVSTFLRHYDRSEPCFSVELDDGATVPDGYFAICLNTNPYTYLGPKPLNVAPEADGVEGLALVTLRDLRVTTLLDVMARALSRRRLVADHPDVDYRPGLRTLRIVGKRPVPHQVDGDYLGDADVLEVTHHPDCLRVVAPT
jgi:diacylglycerol kinase family enzyme